MYYLASPKWREQKNKTSSTSNTYNNNPLVYIFKSQKASKGPQAYFLHSKLKGKEILNTEVKWTEIMPYDVHIPLFHINVYV